MSEHIRCLCDECRRHDDGASDAWQLMQELMHTQYEAMRFRHVQVHMARYGYHISVDPHDPHTVNVTEL